MYKLLPLLLLLCLLFSSCEKILDGVPDSIYKFEVSCSSCTISIANGNDIQTYYIHGYRSIPYDNVFPIVYLSLWTSLDQDETLVMFTGHGYNKTVFYNYLYGDDPLTEIEVDL